MIIPKNHSGFKVHMGEMGDLEVFPPTPGQNRALCQNLQNDFESIEHKEFIRQLVRVSTCPVGVVVDGECPVGFKYEKDDWHDITDDEVERFAELYAHNFIGKQDEICPKNEQIDFVKDGEQGCAEPFKSENENYSEFVHRVKVKELNDFCEILTRLGKKSGFDLSSIKYQSGNVENMHGFSSELKAKMGGALSASESLRKMLEKTTARPPFGLDDTVAFHPQHIDLSEIERRNSEALRKPFEPLYENLEHLNTISTKTATLISSMVDIQNDVANELKSSSDSASHYSRINYRMNWAIAIMTFVSIVSSSVSTYYSVCGSGDMDSQLSKHMVVIESRLKELVETNTSLHDKIVGLTEILASQQRAGKSQEEVLEVRKKVDPLKKKK